PVSDSSLSPSDRAMMIGVDNQITILLYDINFDNSTTGGVVGYFWAKDNFKSSVISYSNERIMFYMDSVLFATVKTGEAPWDITDYWPETVISILGHEFQHMIHFYQKTVMRSYGNGSETWLDEMCALATEDLVANKVLVNGPRGVQYDVPRCIASMSDPSWPNISYGRLPLYNLYNDYSLTKWYSGDYVLVSYAVNYAFAAFLARNYGGAELFRNIVQNQYIDADAIEDALEKSGFPDVTFGQVLQKWAVANLLSDKTDTDTVKKYTYNNGDAAFTTFSSEIGGITYTLGSIDLYNYKYPSATPQVGPYIHDTMKFGLMPQASNYYYEAGTGLTGELTWNIKLKSRVRMNVVVK
ncbi:MAG TPA: peptidase M30, partial [Spirochaetota bacterium]|nr:peptidase M30 [Spirochaetota bacterium]